MNSPFMQQPQHLQSQQFTPLPPGGYSAPPGYGAPAGGMMPVPPLQTSYRGPPPQNGPTTTMQNNFPVASSPAGPLQQPPGRGVNSVPQVSRIPSSSPAPQSPNLGPPHMLPPLNPHTLPSPTNQQQQHSTPLLAHTQSGGINPPVSSHIQPPSSTAQVQSQFANMSISGKQMAQPPPPSSFPSGTVKPTGPITTPSYQPSSFPPAVNGASPPDIISPTQQFQPPLGQHYSARPPPPPVSQAQFVNGTTQATGPGRGPMQPPGHPQGIPPAQGMPPPGPHQGAPPGPPQGMPPPPGGGGPPPVGLQQRPPPLNRPDVYNSGYLPQVLQPPQPPGGYPGQPPQPGAYPGQPPQPGSYPGQPPQPGGYPGQPPQPAGPGVYPPAGAYPGMPQQGQYPQQQARRLDPDHMPSPIQVMQEDQKAKSGLFHTNQKGQVPPLVTTQFTVVDQGNASPRFIRSTMYTVPVTIDMMKQTAVPFGLVISPLACIMEDEMPPPIVDMGELGPVRCIRCKAYMSPFMQFIDGGRKFQCLLCKATTEVPDAYFQHLDHTGQRVDRFERPEFVLGAYEFVATKDYCRENQFPKPPAFIFMIDVSYNNIKSGMVQLLCSQMKDILKLLPREEGAEKSNMRVGFVTYNNTVHFYNVKACLAQPQMLVVGDVNEMFMPLLDGFLVDPVESEAVIDSLMEQIPQMFADTRETETILAPAIQAGMEALKASECAGKLLIFHTSLPTAEAPGKLKNRDDRKMLGTDKEKSVLMPQNMVYNNLAQECVSVGCSVDLFIMNNSYIDVATIGQICRLTGGEIFKYTYFQANIDGERLIADVKHDVSRPIAFDSIMRVRTSTGVRPTDFYGHLFMSNTTDMELASIDCDKAIAIEVKHDDKLTEEEGVYIQVALLYTSCGGQRRIRILNLGLKTCSQMADLYRMCELDTIINFFSKQALFRLREHTPKQVKEGLVNRCAMSLASYRKNCASPSSAGQLILPECMKLLPLYVNCLLKSDALSGGSDMTIDDRTFMMEAVSIMDIPTSVVYFYPRLLPLHDIDLTTTDIPQPIRCSVEKIKDDGAYLLENGIHMFLWFGLGVPSEWLLSVFGVPNAAQVDTDSTHLPEFDNPLSERIRNLICVVRIQRHRFMRLTLVRQRDKMETLMKHFLVEDRGVDGSSSYVDFLCHMHKEIRQILS